MTVALIIWYCCRRGSGGHDYSSGPGIAAYPPSAQIYDPVPMSEMPGIDAGPMGELLEVDAIPKDEMPELDAANLGTSVP